MNSGLVIVLIIVIILMAFWISKGSCGEKYSESCVNLCRSLPSKYYAECIQDCSHQDDPMSCSHIGIPASNIDQSCYYNYCAILTNNCNNQKFQKCVADNCIID